MEFTEMAYGILLCGLISSAPCTLCWVFSSSAGEVLCYAKLPADALA